MLESNTKNTPVTFDGVTKRAEDWAIERGIKWATVQRRRAFGSTWAQALMPGDRRRPFTFGPKKNRRFKDGSALENGNLYEASTPYGTPDG